MNVERIVSWAEAIVGCCRLSRGAPNVFDTIKRCADDILAEARSEPAPANPNQARKDLPAGFRVTVLNRGDDPVWAARQNLRALMHEANRPDALKAELRQRMYEIGEQTLKILKEAGR